jgi:hypothetical protein
MKSIFFFSPFTPGVNRREEATLPLKAPKEQDMCFWIRLKLTDKPTEQAVRIHQDSNICRLLE